MASRLLTMALIWACSSAAIADDAAPAPAKPPTMADVLAATQPADWRVPDPDNTLYLELAAGRVVIELAPAFAPKHVANIKQLVAQRYFDGLAILRSHDNYVVQWGDPHAGEEGKAREVGKAARSVTAEFDRATSDALPFVRLPDGDVYAPEVGFSDGLPVARDGARGRVWLTHCYGMVGAGRDVGADSGSGAELYVVIGHAPRHLDLNVTLVGRVLQGMELLSAMPRGSAALGFYDKPEQRVPIRAVRLAADVPKTERSAIEVMRTDTQTFQRLIETRRNRRDEWYLHPAGKVELCNVPIPVRAHGQ